MCWWWDGSNKRISGKLLLLCIEETAELCARVCVCCSRVKRWHLRWVPHHVATQGGIILAGYHPPSSTLPFRMHIQGGVITLKRSLNIFHESCPSCVADNFLLVIAVILSTFCPQSSMRGLDFSHLGCIRKMCRQLTTKFKQIISAALTQHQQPCI